MWNDRFSIKFDKILYQKKLSNVNIKFFFIIKTVFLVLHKYDILGRAFSISKHYELTLFYYFFLPIGCFHVNRCLVHRPINQMILKEKKHELIQENYKILRAKGLISSK
jgi:hypothetical protein